MFFTGGHGPSRTASNSATPPIASGPVAPGAPAPSGECGTVTVTVTAGQGHPHHHKSHTYVAPSAPATTYEVSTNEVSTYAVASTPTTPESYTVASPQGGNTYTAQTTPAPVGGSVGKRGVAYASIPTLNVGEATGIAWAWNWSPQATGLPEHIEFVPCLKDTSMASDFQQAAGSASYLMSFNEVDMTTGGGGSAMSPEQAAAGYEQYMMPYANTHKLGAPSVTSDTSEDSMLNGVSAASGLDYIKQFAQACSSCKIDFADFHWYGANGQSGAEQAEAFKAYVTQAIETAQQLWGQDTKVWISEFSALPTLDQDTSGVNQEFMENVLSWLDSNSAIERYSYFAAQPGMLTNSDGSLTEIGQTYAMH